MENARLGLFTTERPPARLRMSFGKNWTGILERQCVHAFILTYFSVLQNEGARVERHSQLTQFYVVCSLWLHSHGTSSHDIRLSEMHSRLMQNVITTMCQMHQKLTPYTTQSA